MDKIQRSLVLVILGYLTIISEQKKLKGGFCPFLGPQKAGQCKPECDPRRGDKDCRGKLKCCFTGCAYVCVKPVQPIDKIGFCPLPPKDVKCKGKKAVSNCERDFDCPITVQKCCSNGCAKRCTNPVECKNQRKWRGNFKLKINGKIQKCTKNCDCNKAITISDEFMKKACRLNADNIAVGCCFYCELMGVPPIHSSDG